VSSTRTRTQASIKSFFQPKQPHYTPPPASPNAQPLASNPLKPASQSTSGVETQAQVSGSPDQVSLPQLSPKAAHDPSLPPQATISAIQTDHIQPLRRINSLLLPINYPDSFYHKILEVSPTNFSRVILWTDPQSKETRVVGGIVCRLDPSLAPGSTTQNQQIVEGSFDVYVQSLGLLSPYREKGLATAALNSVIDAATGQDGVRIGGLYAHVWTENTEGLEWYAARGFIREGPVVNGYYRRLKPDTALILRRKLVPSDHLCSSAAIQPFASSIPDLAQSTSTTPQSTAPPGPPQARPPNAPHTKSFQDRRADMEWNDLPEEILGNSLLRAPSSKSGDASAASSRSSSRSGLEGRGKKKGRSYPAAAFGS
jgi:ribosomal protein S18 acetylase RimI-like enzyme